MKRFVLVISLSLIISLSALADDQGAFISKSLIELQRQRDSASNDLVNAKAEAGVYADKFNLINKLLEETKNKNVDLEKQLKTANEKIADFEKQLAEKPKDGEIPK